MQTLALVAFLCCVSIHCVIFLLHLADRFWDQKHASNHHSRRRGKIPTVSAGPEACPWFMPPGKAAMALSPRKATKGTYFSNERETSRYSQNTCQEHAEDRMQCALIFLSEHHSSVCKCFQSTFCELSTSIFPLRNSIASYTVTSAFLSLRSGLDLEHLEHLDLDPSPWR